MQDVIELTDFEFDTIIGILDEEQRIPQRIRVDLRMELPLAECGRTGHLDRSINYADVQAWIMTVAQQGRWRLLESLSQAIARMLLAPPDGCEPRAAIEAIELRIRKLQILDDAVPGVHIRREAAWCDLQEREVADGVVLGSLGETSVQGAWRIIFQPGASWEIPAGRSLHVLGGYGQLHQEGAGRSTLGHGDRVARAPGRTVIAGEDGLALLAVGAPLT